MNKQQLELEAWKLKEKKESINAFMGFGEKDHDPKVQMQYMINEGWLK